MRITEREGKKYIFDSIRKKEVVLTPEEWVRQQIIVYLIKDLNYPSSLFSIEKQIKIGTLRKRYDIVIYKKENPWIIIECKAEDEPLNKNVLQQILAYTATLKVEYLALSNGRNTMVYNIQNDKWQDSFPNY